VTDSGSGDRRLIRRPGGLLAAGAVVALGVAAVAVRAAAGASLRGPGISTVAAVGLALLFAVAALVTAGKYRAHVRANEASTTAQDRLRQATVAILFASAALVPFTLMLLRRPESGQAGLLPDPRSSTVNQKLETDPFAKTHQPSPRAHLNFSLTALLWALLAALGAAALIALIVIAVRLMRKIPPVAPTAATPPADLPDQEDAALADALLAGRSALAGDDARAAIIACYAAMENSLVEAGVAREVSDSPSDLLRRATRRDLPGAGARDAATLTDLFREARYSTHPMTAQHLATARAALDAVTVALAERMRERELEREREHGRDRTTQGADRSTEAVAP
jgi:Domain of unknown function (DUF4129)